MGVFGVSLCTNASHKERESLLLEQRGRETNVHLVSCSLFLRRRERSTTTNAGYGSRSRNPAQPTSSSNAVGELYVIHISSQPHTEFYVLGDHVVSTPILAPDQANNLQSMLCDRMEFFEKEERLTMHFTGKLFELGDFRVALAGIKLKGELKGEMMQVEYAPCTTPSQCKPLMREFYHMFQCPVEVIEPSGIAGKEGNGSDTASTGTGSADSQGKTANGARTVGTTQSTTGNTSATATAAVATTAAAATSATATAAPGVALATARPATRGASNGDNGAGRRAGPAGAGSAGGRGSRPSGNSARLPELGLVTGYERLALEYVRIFKLVTQRGGS